MVAVGGRSSRMERRRWSASKNGWMSSSGGCWGCDIGQNERSERAGGIQHNEKKREVGGRAEGCRRGHRGVMKGSRQASGRGSGKGAHHSFAAQMPGWASDEQPGSGRSAALVSRDGAGPEKEREIAKSELLVREEGRRHEGVKVRAVQWLLVEAVDEQGGEGDGRRQDCPPERERQDDRSGI